MSAGRDEEVSAAVDAGARIDESVPHSARMWNYWLGGRDYYAIDKIVGDQIINEFPGIRDVARQSRACLGRMVAHLAGQEGIRQFLDIGTGLPTHDNTHEVAQRVAPECRVVYVDHDPLVLVHARALLTGTDEGRTAYLECDVRDPARILEAAAKTLDFTRPIGLILFGILGNVIDDAEAAEIVRTLVDALPSGSFVALNDGTGVLDKEGREEAIRIAIEQGSTPYVARTPDELAGFLDGLQLLDPGVVSTSQWRPNPTEVGTPQNVDAACGLARKP
ncbi:SAM-dependent methyltransferase [Actinocorallia sp. API 0066]|uniref:SAM-dependent methyltransferase n=1 Tax=Actinocorallia sp. API 0066 TaxID=2896846 RepID=UPI001E607691|nr:SAM-dependent methyltransferase [Actinocorallia sp. API 0066]MCD0451924.1 SAM-dependent methyltransferase [Actinocorallia sp. API 0066]